VRVHSHEVIIAGTRAEVTPRHNFVIRVADALWTRLGTLSVVPGDALRSVQHATIKPGRTGKE
jgi:hypothetical protein